MAGTAILDRHILGKFILYQILEKRKIGIKDVLGPSRTSYIVAARREFCMEAKNNGIGCVIIGKILKRHSSTILYHSSREMRERKALRRKLYGPYSKSEIQNHVN